MWFLPIKNHPKTSGSLVSHLDLLFQSSQLRRERSMGSMGSSRTGHNLGKD
jgi:hypothetical protein